MRVASTWHGLVATDERRGSKHGVVIAEVQPGSPAEASGFKVGDELLRVGALPVANALDVERGLFDVRPGQPATVKFRRGGNETALSLDVKPLRRLGRRP